MSKDDLDMWEVYREWLSRHLYYTSDPLVRRYGLLSTRTANAEIVTADQLTDPERWEYVPDDPRVPYKRRMTREMLAHCYEHARANPYPDPGVK